MTGRCLLDTNIVIGAFAQDAGVQQGLSEATEVFIPSIVLGELYYGARKSGRVDANVKRVDELADKSSILTCDAETAKHYGRIKDALRAKGTPLPENDIWIAAIASQHELTLISRDAHFDAIDGLTIEPWHSV